MKSEEAEAYLESVSPSIRGCKFCMLSRYQAEAAVDIAEQEAEERMRDKAIKAFCEANCPKGCSFGADGNIGCAAKGRFIQKLKKMKKIEEMLNRASDEVAMVEVFDTSETSFKRVDIIRKGYFEAGAEWMREELTRWHDPKKELPDTNRDVLVKTTLCSGWSYRIP